MVALLATLLASGAHAATATVCIEVDTNFDDSDITGATEDYWRNNGVKPLRGVQIKLVENFGAQAEVTSYAAWGGNDPGCTTFSNVSTTTGETYTIQVRSHFSIRSSTIDVRSSETGTPWLVKTLATSRQFTMGNLTADHTVGPHRVWNVGGAAAWALARRDGGRTLTPTFYVTDSNGTLTSPCGGPCVQGDDVYIDDDGARLKFAIAYQLGWVLADDLGVGSLNWSISNPSDCTSQGDKDLSSAEYWPAAAADGLAHFYAASAFNDLAETDCGYTYWRDVDFDGMGPPCFDAVDTDALRPISCATGRAPLVPATNQLDYCATSTRTTFNNPASTAIDFLRLWWDIDTHETNVGFADIVDIYLEADPANWSNNTAADWETDAHAVVSSANWATPVADYLERHGVPTQ